MIRPPWLSPPYEPPNVSLGGFITLTNIGTAYDTNNTSRGLGLVQVDFTNITGINWGVYINKIGTGTQDWQLWNETDGVELGIISDAGATGVTKLEGIITSGLPTGIKLIRIRA